MYTVHTQYTTCWGSKHHPGTARSISQGYLDTLFHFAYLTTHTCSCVATTLHCCVLLLQQPGDILLVLEAVIVHTSYLWTIPSFVIISPLVAVHAAGAAALVICTLTPTVCRCSTLTATSMHAGLQQKAHCTVGRFNVCSGFCSGFRRDVSYTTHTPPINAHQHTHYIDGHSQTLSLLSLFSIRRPSFLLSHAHQPLSNTLST